MKQESEWKSAPMSGPYGLSMLKEQPQKRNAFGALVNPELKTELSNYVS